MIRVLIADDHAFFRHTLAGLLAAAGGFATVGECADGDEIPAIARSARPDVVVMDVRMPRLDGIEAVRRLRAGQPEVRVLMLSSSASPRLVDRAARAGASGYLIKGCESAALIDAVRMVAPGGSCWPG